MQRDDLLSNTNVTVSKKVKRASTIIVDVSLCIRKHDGLFIIFTSNYPLMLLYLKDVFLRHAKALLA